MRRAAWLLPLLLAGCLQATAPPEEPAGGAAPEAATVRFPALRFETDHGAFTAILFANETPQTAEFVTRLVESGYYDGREFNRVIPGFVIQEVDRAGGATDQPEKVALEAGTSVFFSAGAFGIARDADPNSGGSEFFVMDFAHSHLHGNYTAFAQVVDGMDVVRAIARVQAVSTRPRGLPVDPPALPVHDRVAVAPGRIERATVTEVEMTAREAARYPLVVGNRTVVDSTRYTPEWPRDLGPGVASELTWYVYTPADDPLPDLSGAVAAVAGPDGEREIPVSPDPVDPRILRWAWTPAQAGAHTLTLRLGGTDVASVVVELG